VNHLDSGIFTSVRVGVLLAGGTGSRLGPLTLGVSKHLLAVHDKPMIFYSLCSLMLAGVRDIIIVAAPCDIESFRKLLGHGEDYGVSIRYAAQQSPGGVADALLAAEELVAERPIAVTLGDNFFHGPGLAQAIGRVSQSDSGAAIFTIQVAQPSRYGVVTFSDDGEIAEICEKPRFPDSNWAVPGLYFYDSQAFAFARLLNPSARGELEISDLNQLYLKQDRLRAVPLPTAVRWADLGSVQALQETSDYVMRFQQATGHYIGCPEEVAFSLGWLPREQLVSRARFMPSDYGRYLLSIVNG